MTYVYRATLAKRGSERRTVWVLAKSMGEACEKIEALCCPESTLLAVIRESGTRDMCIS